MPPRLLALLLALALAGCGGGGGETQEEAAAPAGPDPGPQHIHGLGIDPADGSLVIATHAGVYRAPEGELRARRIGEARADTMGFVVVGPEHYLASGHPALSAEAAEAGEEPQQLGLVESTDGGETWEPVSLEGEADLHALRVVGDRLYGFDSIGHRLLVSDDGGRTWEEHDAHTNVVDLVVHPDDPEHIVAAGRDVLVSSRDGGRSWEPLGDPIGERVGLLAWPEADELFLADEAGRIWTSEDAGQSWRSVGAVEDRPLAFHAESVDVLYAALADGTVRRSADGGRSWRVRARP